MLRTECCQLNVMYPVEEQQYRHWKDPVHEPRRMQNLSSLWQGEKTLEM